MKTTHHIAVPLFTALLVAMSPLASGVEKSLAQEMREARIEGQIATAFALNRHLSVFEISTEADGTTVILTGAVEEAIDKDLAEQVALGVEGVTKVENKITVRPDMEAPERKKPAQGEKRDFATTVEDATITASVKSRLLWNRHIDGLDINVDTRDGIVNLRGIVATSAAKDLAERLASNTEGVREVNNHLDVEPGGADTLDKAKASLDKAGETVSDGWITTRVKSSLLYSKSVDGTDIHVETRDGVVELRGLVSTRTERDLAVAIAKDIRGVRDVDAKKLMAEQRS